MKFFCGKTSEIKDITECEKQQGEKCLEDEGKCSKSRKCDSNIREFKKGGIEQSFI